MTGDQHGNPPGNAFPVQLRRRTVAEVGIRSHVVDETVGAPHGCWARIEQAEEPPPPCDCSPCTGGDR